MRVYAFSQVYTGWTILQGIYLCLQRFELSESIQGPRILSIFALPDSTRLCSSVRPSHNRGLFRADLTKLPEFLLCFARSSKSVWSQSTVCPRSAYVPYSQSTGVAVDRLETWNAVSVQYRPRFLCRRGADTEKCGNSHCAVE